MNKVLLVGYLTADPDFRNYTERELKMARFSIAVNDIRNYSQTYFFNCIAWNQTAEYIGNNLTKGDFVCIDGKLTTRSYVNNEGKKVSVVEVVVENIKNIGSRKNKANETEEKVSLDDVFEDIKPVSNEDVVDNSNVENNEVKNDNIPIDDDLVIDWEEDLK